MKNPTPCIKMTKYSYRSMSQLTPSDNNQQTPGSDRLPIYIHEHHDHHPLIAGSHEDLRSSGFLVTAVSDIKWK